MVGQLVSYGTKCRHPLALWSPPRRFNRQGQHKWALTLAVSGAHWSALSRAKLHMLRARSLNLVVGRMVGRNHQPSEWTNDYATILNSTADIRSAELGT